MARRSPPYPSLSLREAIARARQFYNKEATNRTAPEIAIEHFGFSPKGSTGVRCLAAVLHYALMEDEGAKDDRRVWVSELGMDILLDEREDSTERKRAIQKAAVSPKVFAEIWEKWGPTLPSDASIRHYLLRERSFNPKSVDDFINVFRATVEFANLTEPVVSSGGEDDIDSGDERDGDPPRDTDLFSNISTALVPTSPKREEKPMSPTPPTPSTPISGSAPVHVSAGSSPVYSVVTGEGVPIGALQVRVPLNKDEFELLEMELDHRLNMLAKMNGFQRKKGSDD